MKRMSPGTLASVFVLALLLIAGPASSTPVTSHRAALATSNVLGLHLRLGEVQISCLFASFTATLSRSDRGGLVFASKYQVVAFHPDVRRPGGMTVDLGSTSHAGLIETGTRDQSILSIDNVGRFTLTRITADNFVLSGGLPFDVHLSWAQEGG